jgi:FkbM family methyltransferase
MEPMISYALNHEDVVLNRIFNGKSRGFYIDIGANHPVYGSTTKHFSDLGWTGICVEPVQCCAVLLRRHRPRDVVLEVAVSETAGRATLYEVGSGLSTSSTFSRDLADRYRAEGKPVAERTIPVLTLADICLEHVRDCAVDFLTIDVEGAERAVLGGMDFTRWQPRVVVVEATLPDTNIPTHEGWESILLSAGYVCGQFDGINRFYVRRDDPKLFNLTCAPANYLDNYRDARTFELFQELELYRQRYEGLGRIAVVAARRVQSVVNLARRVNRAVTGRERW